MKSFIHRLFSRNGLAAVLSVAIVGIGWMAIAETPSGESQLSAVAKSVTRTTRTLTSGLTVKNAASPGITHNIGIGLDGFAPYSPLTAYCDVTTVLAPWVITVDEDKDSQPGDWGKYGLYKRVGRLTADNYPVDKGMSYSAMRDYPSGGYKVSYTGPGTISFSGQRYQSISNWTGGNPKTATLNLGPVGDLRVVVQGEIHNLKIISPEPECASGALFRNMFVNIVKPFKAIRFMDWQQTNWSVIKTWEDRPRSHYFSRTKAFPPSASRPEIDPAYTAGMPYEDMIALANQLQKDVWINIPHMADDDFIRRFARMWRDGLNPDLKIYIEWSNEVWNTGFVNPNREKPLGGQWGYAAVMGAQDDRIHRQDANDVRIRYEYMGLMTKRVADIFKQEFGTTRFTSHVIPVQAGNISYDYGLKYALDQVAKSYPNDPGAIGFHNIRALAVAPYAGVASDMKYIGKDDGDVTTLLAGLRELTDVWLKTWLKNTVNQAKAYNLPVLAYEAGQSLQNSNNAANKLAAQTDPRMQAVYKNIYDMWNAETNNGLIMQFGLVTNYSDFGYWGPLETMTNTNTPKMRALQELMAGKVTEVTPVQCTNACTFGAQQCTGGTGGSGIQTCQMGSNGCTTWGSLIACGAGTQCTATGNSVACQMTQQQCSNTYQPVCGSNGVTYNNNCLAGNASTQVSYSGMCQTTRLGDLEILTKTYNTSCSVANAWCNGGDITRDGNNDFNDLVVISQNFGRSDCSQNNNWCTGGDINRDGIVSGVAPGAANARGDVNNDGFINSIDLLLLRKSYNKVAGFTPTADLNSDGLIDRKDYLVYTRNNNGGTSIAEEEDENGNLDDLAYIRSMLGATRGQTSYKQNADLNLDNVIDNKDLSIRALELNITLPNVVTPTPTNLQAGLTATFYNNPTALTGLIGTATVNNIQFWTKNPYQVPGYTEFPVVSESLSSGLGFSGNFTGKVMPKKDASGNPILGTNVYQMCVYFSGLTRVSFDNQLLYNYWPTTADFAGYGPTAECKTVSMTENKPYDFSLDYGKGVLLRVYWRVNGTETSMSDSVFH